MVEVPVYGRARKKSVAKKTRFFSLLLYKDGEDEERGDGDREENEKKKTR